MLRKILLVLATASVLNAAASAQDDPFLGRWEFNATKSSVTRGRPPQRETIVNVSEPGGFTSTLTSVSERGTSVEVHHYIFDGAFHATEGGDARELSFVRVDRRTIDSDTKRNGQITVRRRIALSPDGRTLTAVASGTSGGGQPYTNDTRVYDRR